jgi:hypothetical protein
MEPNFGFWAVLGLASVPSRYRHWSRLFLSFRQSQTIQSLKDGHGHHGQWGRLTGSATKLMIISRMKNTSYVPPSGCREQCLESASAQCLAQLRGSGSGWIVHILAAKSKEEHTSCSTEIFWMLFFSRNCRTVPFCIHGETKTIKWGYASASIPKKGSILGWSSPCHTGPTLRRTCKWVRRYKNENG